MLNRLPALLAFLLTFSLQASTEFYTPERDKYLVEDQTTEATENLPKVLLIGDSIMGGYAKYNQVALRVMQKHGVAVNDLYALSSEFGVEMYVSPGDVHHTGKANKKLAEQVAEVVREQLH